MKRNGKLSWLKTSVIGTIIATAISVGLTALLANLVLKGSVEESGTGWYVFGIRLLSVAVGSLVGTGLADEKILPVIGVVSGGYLVALLALGIVFFDGSFRQFGLGLLSVLIGGGLACAVRLMPRKSNKRAVRTRR